MRLPTLTALGFFILSTSQFVSADNNSDYYLTGNGNKNSEIVDKRDVDIRTPIDLPSKVIIKKRGSDDYECAKYHTVSGKDTCITVSKQYGIKLDQFYEWNQQVNDQCTNLNNGKKYCVATKSTSGGSSSGSGCAQTHTVKSSDSCVKIAKQYGINVKDFYSLNPSVHRGSCDNLNDGQKYCVKQGNGSSDEKDHITSKVTNFAAKTNKKKKGSPSHGKKGKLLQSNTAFTYYWIATPDDYSQSGKKVTVKTCSGKSLGKVSEKYADALVMEGTGLLGKSIINLGGCSCSGYKCFEEVNAHSDPFGLTSYGTPLRPYVTIASNDIPKNKKLYVPQLDGWTLPNSNKKHNGCLLSDDQSWSFGGHHIDFYVYKQAHYKTLDKQHRITKVDIYDGGDCELQDYM